MMKLTVWMLTRERDTWILGAEVLGLLLVILGAPGAFMRLLGVLLLAHVGYRALTSLPMGQVPGKPVGTKAVRRNQDLRTRVVGFLNEMRRAEDFAQQAEVGGKSRTEVERDVAWARKRMLAAAAEVVKAAGRPGRTDRASLGEEEPDTGLLPSRRHTEAPAPERTSLWEDAPAPPSRRGSRNHPA